MSVVPLDRYHDNKEIARAGGALELNNHFDGCIFLQSIGKRVWIKIIQSFFSNSVCSWPE